MITRRTPNPFTQDDDLVRVLDTLPESVLLATIRDRVAIRDLSWLGRMVTAGFFDAHSGAQGAKNAESKNQRSDALDQWSARCMTMLSVMKQAKLLCPCVGVTAKHMPAAHPLPDAAQDFFANFCQHLGAQAPVWIKRGKTPLAVEKLMSQAMGLAALLDRSDLLANLASAFPASVNLFFGEDVMGKGIFSKSSTTNKKMEIGPLFCALHFSSAQCVKALLPFYDRDKGLYATLEQGTLESVDPIESFNHLIHRGSPSAMVPLLAMLSHQAVMDGKEEKSPLVEVFRNIMHRQDGKDASINAAMLPAFVRSGAADLDPSLSLVCAVEFNRPEVVAHFDGRINWKALSERSNICMNALRTAIDKKATQALVDLMALAKASGHGSSFLNAFVLDEEGFVRVGAVRPMVSSPAGVAVLPHALELGLDPNATIKTGSTVKEFAAKYDFGGLEVLHSFMARSLARALIEGIERDESASVHRSPLNPC